MIAKHSLSGKRSKNSPLWVWIIIVFILIAGALLVLSNVRMYEKRRQLQAQENDIKKQIQGLLLRTKGLQTQIIQVDTTSYQEKVLREQGLYKKPGEEVVTVIPAEAPKAETPKKSGVIWRAPLEILMHFFGK